MRRLCPYCQEALPFANIVLQRLSPGPENRITCPHCSSVISSSAGARLAPLAGGSTGLGILVGKLLASLGTQHLTAVLAGTAIAVGAVLVGAYIFAPIRSG